MRVYAMISNTPDNLDYFLPKGPLVNRSIVSAFRKGVCRRRIRLPRRSAYYTL